MPMQPWETTRGTIHGAQFLADGVLPRASCCAYRCQRMVGDDVSRGVPAPDCGRNVDRA